MPIWLQSTVSTEAPTKTKLDRAEVSGDTKSNIYIKPTRSQHTQRYYKHFVIAGHASCHDMTSESPSKMFPDSCLYDEMVTDAPEHGLTFC